MKPVIYATLTAMLTATCLCHADQPLSDEGWQINRLFQPSATDVASEKKGRVMIYDRLTDRTVDRALDNQFERIGTFMFVRTVVTDSSGNPQRDPQTGELVVEEDGCD